MTKAEIYVEAKSKIKRSTPEEKKERKKMLLHAFWYSHGCPCENEE